MIAVGADHGVRVRRDLRRVWIRCRHPREDLCRPDRDHNHARCSSHRLFCCRRHRGRLRERGDVDPGCECHLLQGAGETLRCIGRVSVSGSWIWTLRKKYHEYLVYRPRCSPMSKSQGEAFAGHVNTAFFGTALAPVFSEILFSTSLPIEARLPLSIVTSLITGFVLAPLASAACFRPATFIFES